MANVQASKKFHFRVTPRVRAWAAIIILATLGFILSRAVWSIYRKNELADSNKEATLIRLAELKDREHAVVEKLAGLDTPEGVEEEIRRVLPMAKPGEHVINIIDPKPKIGGNEEASTTAKRGFWAALLKGL